ncbi:PAS domain S-box protein [Polaribacter sp. KT 15]|uniref:PAS domain S-box protein n=1 Tax=Polaribacter sp. KT 15 TaxID=1896175 RepID=UPI00090B76E2|nr:PAS domain S-box protein [Polaribacter sp. KT 15]SHM74253.1 PAS domain S-box-containing protein [Polaribacter sp. KT 15]
MNNHQLIILLTQGTIAVVIILALFRFRKKIGNGILHACLGVFQFIQAILFVLNNGYNITTSKIIVTPGSSVFITIILFVLLIVYIKEDVKETKKIIYTITGINIIIYFILLAFLWNLNDTKLNASNLFINETAPFIIGKITLFIDTLLLIIVFEYISKKIKYFFLQITLTMIITLSFDTVFFTTIAFFQSEEAATILKTGLINKNIFAVYYSVILYIYLRFLDETDKDLVYFKIKDVFKPLSYKQKFEVAVNDIKKANEMYRLLTTNSNDIICLQELNGNYSYISPSIKNILGYKQSDFLGKQIFSIVHKDDIKELQKKISEKEFLKNNKKTPLIFRLKHKSGEYLWMEYSTSPIYQDGKVTSFVTSAREITDRIKSKKQLEKSLKLLRKRDKALNKASEMGKIGFIEYNAKKETYVWSDYVFEIFGLSPEDNIPSQKEFLNFFTEESKAKIIKKIENLESNGKAFNLEVKGKNQENKIIWLRLIMEPIFGDNKKMKGLRGILQDITKSKNSKIALRNSYNLLKKKDLSLIESSRIAKIGYSDYLFETNSFYWSDYVYKIFGLNPNKEIPSREEMIAVYKGEFLEKLISATKKLDSDGKPYDIELKMTNFKNKEVWVRIIGHLIYDEDKNVLGRSGVLQDITDSKLNRIELKRSKKEIENSLEQLEKNKASMDEASKVAKIGYFEYIIATDDFRWSEYLYDIYGLDKTKPVPPRAEIVAQIDKDSLPVIKQATLDLTNNGVSYDIQMKIYHKKTGKAVWVRNVAQPVFDENKNIIGRRGLVQDITDKKESIDKIARAEELYRLLADNTNDLICLQEHDSTFKYISPSIENLLGYKQEEFIGRKVYDIVHPEDLESLKSTFFNISKEVKSHAFPFRALHKKGHYIWLEFLSTPVYNGDEINYFVTSARDITQTMVANENIQEYQKSLKRLTTEITLIEEKQKKEIASNIHDHLSQSLVISKMKIKELKHNKEYQKLIKDLEFIENHITDALDNSRKITFELSPPILYQLGIVDALFWLFEYIEKTYEIKSDINTTLDTVRMDDTKSILLYRSIQEVVNNAVKYSKASLFTLNIYEKSNYISFIFKDNGNGFDTKKLKNNHNTNGSGFGLFTVKERIGNIQGEFNISSEIGVGTTVVFNIPKSIIKKS